MKRWQNGLMMLVGAWMVLSPWMLGFLRTDRAATLSAFLLGGAIVMLAAASAYYPEERDELMLAGLGGCCVAMPWIVGFVSTATAYRNAVIVGALTILLALSAMLSQIGVPRRLRDLTAAVRERLGPPHHRART